ncbi:hypothetical protein ACJ41O_000784 [Fusarium nematophilum]
MKTHPDATLSELCRLTFPAAGPERPGTEDEIDALALGVKALLMIDPSALHHSSDRLEKGTFRVHWQSDMPFSKYVQDLFPPGNHNILSYNNSELFADVKRELRAVNLKKRLGITMRATSDIRNHLQLDRRNNVLEVYHYASFLKEQLRKLLRSLVSKCAFDPDLLNFQVSSVRRVGEESVPYVYLADRLADLYNELQSPRPRGWFQQSMQRKSSARHVMIATLIGVVFAILLGMASLAVSSYQAWIAYQAWKYPVVIPG